MVKQIPQASPNYLKLQDIYNGRDTVKLIQSVRLRVYGQIERMNKERMPNK